MLGLGLMFGSTRHAASGLEGETWPNAPLLISIGTW